MIQTFHRKVSLFSLIYTVVQEHTFSLFFVYFSRFVDFFYFDTFCWLFHTTFFTFVRMFFFICKNASLPLTSVSIQRYRTLLGLTSPHYRSYFLHIISVCRCYGCEPKNVIIPTDFVFRVESSIPVILKSKTKLQDCNYSIQDLVNKISFDCLVTVLFRSFSCNQKKVRLLSSSFHCHLSLNYNIFGFQHYLDLNFI